MFGLSPRRANSDQTCEHPTWPWVVIALALTCTLVSWPVISASADRYPGGIDTMGHLSKAYSLANRILAGQANDWYPEWYMGATVTQYYPPLSIWLTTLVQVVTRNIMLTFKIVTWTLLFLGGLATARLARRLGCSLGGEITSAVLYSTGNYTLFSVFVDGTLGRAICLPLFPLLLHSLIDLSEEQSLRKWIGSCSLVVSIVLSHAMHAYLLFFTTAIFMLVFCVSQGNGLMRVARLLEVALLGIVLTGFWALPGSTQLENPGIPTSPPEMASIRTMDLRTILSPSSPLASTVMFVAGIVACVWILVRDQRNGTAWALLSSTVITLSFIYGPSNPLYNLLPLGNSLAPLRFLNAAFLPAALAAGLFADLVVEYTCSLASAVNRRVLALFVAAIVILSSMAVNTRLGVPEPLAYSDLRAMLDEIPKSQAGIFDVGRLAEDMPKVGAQTTYFPLEQGLAITTGWNIEGTIHIYTLHNHNLAYFEDYPDYVLRNWYLWNARSALVDSRYERMIERLRLDGWSIADEQTVAGNATTLALSSQPSSYLMELNSDAIVIGRSSFYVARLFPWITEGRNPNPLEYDDSYIDLFRCIYLYDLPTLDCKQLETRIVEWVNRGKTVIVDLSASTTIQSLFGARHTDITVDGDLSFTSSVDDNMYFAGTKCLFLKNGRGAVYEGLDGTLVTVEYEGQSRSVVGYRQLQRGRVYFTGLHIPRLVQRESADDAISLIDPLLNLSSPRKSICPMSFKADKAIWSYRGLSFNYHSETSRAVMISVTYAPRWRVFVDGQRIPLYDHENLVLLKLPAGKHEVQMRYGKTWVVAAGWITTGVGLVYASIRVMMIRRRVTFSMMLRGLGYGHAHSSDVQ